MSSRLHSVAVDAIDPELLARFWSAALGLRVDTDDDGDLALRAEDGSGPYLLLLRVPDPKRTKNRLHLDLIPDDQDAEVERLLALGATRADVGQGEQSWIVLADPEGNEFCVLRPGGD
jgi:catechol 2,3-dioxygenase-like lactoylglutathione lyase family enzyme